VESATFQVSTEEEYSQTQLQIYCKAIYLLTTRYLFRAPRGYHQALNKYKNIKEGKKVACRTQLYCFTTNL
jgi:hypothetical protein